MAKSSTEQRTEITNEIMIKLEDSLRTTFEDDIFYTGDNLTTLTFLAGQVNGEDVYGSIKFTLHKAAYDLDEEIEKYELFREEKELKAKARAQKKEADAKKDKERKAKAAQREAEKAQSKNKVIKSIEKLKEEVTED